MFVVKNAWKFYKIFQNCSLNILEMKNMFKAIAIATLFLFGINTINAQLVDPDKVGFQNE